jgi:hypothetical protein
MAGMLSINEGEIINNGTISVSGTGNASNIGMLIYDAEGLAINNGIINVNNNQIGIYGYDESKIINN